MLFLSRERTACQHQLRITCGRLVIRPPVEDILVLLGTHLEGPLLKGSSAHVPGHRLGLGHEVAFKILPAPRRKKTGFERNDDTSPPRHPDICRGLSALRTPRPWKRAELLFPLR